MSFKKGTSENSIIFFQGGHSHDGVSSALIDTNKYSIYDFIVGKTGSSARQATQQRNYDSLKGVISSIITTDILGPSGVRLGPNSVQSVNISAGAVTASELAANIVLVNNIISSSNFDGTVAANGVITGQGTAGWAITSAGDAVFSNTAIRGTLTAGALYINANNQWNANGTIIVGNPGDTTPGFAFSPTTGLAVTGKITATSGRIASFDVIGATLYTGDSFIGWIALGPVDDAAYGGVPAGEILVATRAPSDNHEVYASMRGEKFLIQDVDAPTRFTEITRDGITASGTITADSFIAPSVVYPYAANQIAFYWDGTQIYAVIDGQTQICLTHCGSGPAPEGGGGVGSVETVDPVSPGGECPVCPTHVEPCCPPAQCYNDEVKLGHFCA
jgi:hypothetical protein